MVGAFSLCACGSAGKLTCTDDAACGDGKRCARTVAGESSGVCVADYQLAFTSPADQALVTAGGVPVTVELTLGSAAQPAPESLELLVDGEPAGTLSLTSRADRVASYVGSLTLEGGQTASLEAVAARGTLDEVRAGPVRVTGKSTPPPPPPPPDPPKVASVTLACLAGAQLCVRDETIAVAATVENGPALVRVSTELAPETHYTLSNSGSASSYSGGIPLSRVPFPAFTRSVTATVEALDGSGSVVSSKTVQVTVTRLRWSYPAGVAVTSPAVMDDGTVVVGLSRARDQLLALEPDGSQSWVTTLEAQSDAGGAVTSAPTVGKKAIWVGSDDGRVYGVKLDGSGLVANGICPAPGATLNVGHILTPLVFQLPAAQGATPEEAVYTGGPAGKFYQLVPSAASGQCVSRDYYRPETVMVASPVMSSSGDAFLAVRDPSKHLEPDSVLLYTISGQTPGRLEYGDYEIVASTPLGMGVDGNGALLFADGGKGVDRLVRRPSSTLLDTGWRSTTGDVQYHPEALVVSSGNQPIIGGQRDGGGRVNRLSATGQSVPAWQSSLGPGSSEVTGLALATVDASGVALYATTSSGDLFALDQNGDAVWNTRSGATQLLGTGSLDFPTIAPAATGQALPTLYAGSADGHLYAVVVDTGLDPASPWPKAHHDLRNTGNAMPVR